MNVVGPPSDSSKEESRQIPILPRANAVTAIIVAVASLAAAVAVLVLVPDDAGKAAAGAIATAGLTLAGRLGTPSR